MTFSIGYLITGIVFTVVWFIVIQLIRRRVAKPPRGEAQLVLGVSSTLIATIFAFLCGFIIVNLWEDYNRAASLIQTETAAIHAIYRLAEKNPNGEKLRATLAVYSHAVLEDEWKEMMKGRMSPSADAAKESVWEAALEFTRAQNGNIVIEQAVLDNLLRLDTARSGRMEFVQGTLHPLLATVIFILGMFTLLSFAFVDVPHANIQLMMDAFVTATVMLLIYLIFEINAPFSGTGVTVSDAPFRELLKELIRGAT